MSVETIDVDDPGSWPDDVFGHVREVADAVEGSTEYTADLPLDPGDEETFRLVLDGRHLRAYHCTRLLDHEVDRIAKNGLRLLSKSLVEERIGDAQDAGHISPTEATHLMKGHVFEVADESIFGGFSNREGMVHLFLSRRTFDLHVSGIWRLLATWGGEGIYFTNANSEMEHRLRSIGKPAIVVARIGLSPSSSEDMVFPGLLKSFVARLLGFDDYDSSVVYRSAIPAENVIDIWQPGGVQYDAHNDLPQS